MMEAVKERRQKPRQGSERRKGERGHGTLRHLEDMTHHVLRRHEGKHGEHHPHHKPHHH